MFDEIIPFMVLLIKDAPLTLTFTLTLMVLKMPGFEIGFHNLLYILPGEGGVGAFSFAAGQGFPVKPFREAVFSRRFSCFPVKAVLQSPDPGGSVQERICRKIASCNAVQSPGVKFRSQGSEHGRAYAEAHGIYDRNQIFGILDH